MSCAAGYCRAGGVGDGGVGGDCEQCACGGDGLRVGSMIDGSICKVSTAQAAEHLFKSLWAIQSKLSQCQDKQP